MKRGQSIIELVFAIVLIGLVLTGVVSLIVKSSGGQTKSTARDKAVTLSRIAMETMVAESKNDPVAFWGRSGSMVCPGITEASYTCNISFVSVTDPPCTATTCRRVQVTINWQNESPITFERFFSR